MRRRRYGLRGKVFPLAACLALLLGLVACSNPSVTPKGLTVPRDSWGHRPGPRGFRTVMLDAGHGGSDSGAFSRHTGQREKDLALDVARRVQALLAPDFRVLMLRDRDEFVDLDQRVAIASRRADVLISIHFNHGPSYVRGPETYYWRVDSAGLARRLQRAMEAVSPAEYRHRGLVRRRLRLTRNPQIPCVLVEGGYLTHPAEARLLASPAYRQRLAAAITQAVRDQAQYGDAGMGPLPPPLYQPLSRPTDPRE